ncbi:flavin mononucleotide hydrolase 1, chloroplatic-like [Silene latifolia]|uniref:flavin mononucleotide hydrolase 1, chloroplatic-like n=1 Tax=Silene latifolia TaxID=37657 RepID=UPI003D77179B
MALQVKPITPFNLKHSLNQSKSKLGSSVIMQVNKNQNFSTTNVNRKLPVLLFDVMDTIVRDPFYQDIPQFFGMPMKELLECKHPTAWNEFEKGLIDEDELARKFFKDGRHFDLEGLKMCMKNGYSYIDGVEGLLSSLKHNNYEMHAFTNYPIWYQMIEEKLKLSNYLSWTFCSCTIGKQKPDPEFYSEVLSVLDVEPGSCIFIDDRMKNIEGAVNAGMIGLQFKDADVLRSELLSLGVNISSEELTSTG